MIHGLIEGRICHYLDANLQHLAATVVKVVDKNKGLVNLHAHSQNSGELLFLQEVPFMPQAKNRPETWHWVEKVD